MIFANSKLLPFCSAVIFPVTVTPVPQVVVAIKVKVKFWSLYVLYVYLQSYSKRSQQMNKIQNHAKYKSRIILDQNHPIYKLLPFLLSGLGPLPPLVSTKAVPKPMTTTSRRTMIRESITDCFPCTTCLIIYQRMYTNNSSVSI